MNSIRWRAVATALAIAVAGFVVPGIAPADHHEAAPAAPAEKSGARYSLHVSGMT